MTSHRKRSVTRQWASWTGQLAVCDLRNISQLIPTFRPRRCYLSALLTTNTSLCCPLLVDTAFRTLRAILKDVRKRSRVLNVLYRTQPRHSPCNTWAPAENLRYAPSGQMTRTCTGASELSPCTSRRDMERGKIHIYCRRETITREQRQRTSIDGFHGSLLMNICPK